MGVDEGFDIYPILDPDCQDLYDRFLDEIQQKYIDEVHPVTGQALIRIVGEPKAENAYIYFQFGEGPIIPFRCQLFLRFSSKLVSFDPKVASYLREVYAIAKIFFPKNIVYWLEGGRSFTYHASEIAPHNWTDVYAARKWLKGYEEAFGTLERLNLSQSRRTKCANCNTLAEKKCAGCMDAPEYRPDEAAFIVYCSRDCQQAHWPSHKAQCNVLQRRKKLLRIATILKATLLAYRECAFDVVIDKIDFREGVLCLHQGPKQNRPFLTRFPNDLTANIEYRAAALANNQCTLAMALLGPLARQLLAGVSFSIVSTDISVGKPVFTTRLVTGSKPPSHALPPHTVLVVELRNNEKWIIDAAGCQFGFQDVLTPFDTYFNEKVCRDLGRSKPYDATETSDIDYFMTLPFMIANQGRKKLMEERAVRLHFAAFVKTRIDEARDDFTKHMLCGSASVFQAKLDVFVRDLKVCMTSLVEKTYGKAGVLSVLKSPTSSNFNWD